MEDSTLEEQTIIIKKTKSSDISSRRIFIGKCIRDAVYITLEDGIEISGAPQYKKSAKYDIPVLVYSEQKRISAFPDDTDKEIYSQQALEDAMINIGYPHKEQINQIAKRIPKE